MRALATDIQTVEAELQADANFIGINESGRVHYLLGMCEAKLASANREIARLRKLNEAMKAELDEVQA